MTGSVKFPLLAFELLLLTNFTRRSDILRQVIGPPRLLPTLYGRHQPPIKILTNLTLLCCEEAHIHHREGHMERKRDAPPSP